MSANEYYTDAAHGTPSTTTSATSSSPPLPTCTAKRSGASSGTCRARTSSRLPGGYFGPMDPNNLLCQSSKWQIADVSAHTGSDLAAALIRITARMTVVAFTCDTFFPPQDIEADTALIPGATFAEIGTVWGHFTMFNLREQDTAAIDDIYRKVLAG